MTTWGDVFLSTMGSIFPIVVRTNYPNICCHVPLPRGALRREELELGEMITFLSYDDRLFALQGGRVVLIYLDNISDLFRFFEPIG